jgi:primosomal protein N' (replication factor Y)
VLVQTSCPAEPAILKASQHDYPGFALAELEHRRQMQAPPFEHLLRVIVRGPDEKATLAEARRMADLLRTANAELASPVRILGPAPAPVARLKGSYRFHFQLSATAVEHLQQLWRAAGETLKPAGNVEFTVDMDPVNLR